MPLNRPLPPRPCAGWRQRLLAALTIAAAAGCASPPTPPAEADPSALFQDALMGLAADAGSPANLAAARQAERERLFEMSDEMRRFAQQHLQAARPGTDLRQRLVDALYNDSALRIRYDADQTLTAAQAFAQRRGNCLTLVVLTAAFAKHLGLPLSYQRVRVDEVYTRQQGMTLAAGHVNLVLAPPMALRGVPGRGLAELSEWTVDFLPGADLRGQRSEPLDEDTLVAMALNNQAVAALVQQDLRSAYGLARAAVRQAPTHAAALNTLGVIYQRAGHAAPAEDSFRQALVHDADNKAALGNLAELLSTSGREAQAQPLRQRLAALQPVPPFQHLERGRQALAAGDAAAARDHFLQELRLQPEQHEAHFWAAQAWLQLGDVRQAARHLELAADNSPSTHKQLRYTAKLQHLRDSRVQ